MPEEKKRTRLYANRFLMLLGAALCAGFGTEIWAMTHQQDTTSLSLYDIVLKVLIISVCWLICGVGTLLMLFWTVAWIPLIELDEQGMRWRLPIWRVPPLQRQTVEWRDVRSISATKAHTSGPYGIKRRYLKLTFHMKHAATITHHVPKI